MSKGSKFKDRVRARMARTGESYVTARRNQEIEERTHRNGVQSSVEAAPENSRSVPAATQTQERGVSAIYISKRTAFRAESIGAWKAMISRLLGTSTARRWTNVDEIIHLLAMIGREAPLNHMFLPDGGGQDLTTARISHESNCAEMDLGSLTYIVGPASLELYQPTRDPDREWSYFRLETRELTPSGAYDSYRNAIDEPLVELKPGAYIPGWHWEDGTYGSDENGDSRPLPAEARSITRLFRGPFLITAKASGYVALEQYDGYHARRSATQLQQDIEDVVASLHRDGIYGADLHLRSMGVVS